MTSPNLDILAIGDAIVDVIATCSDAFVEERGLQKGSMQLVEPDEVEQLYAAMGSARETSGGSAANSMAGVAALGGSAAFIGLVAEDQLGAIFTHDMRALGVRFETPPLATGLPTGRCLILVTPDAQRTMNTCPGASHELGPEMLDEALIRSAAITYLEGYLWGPVRPRQAMQRAAEIAYSAGRTVAFTVSGSLKIAGRLEGVRELIDSGRVDILFANEDEAWQLTNQSSTDRALTSLSAKVATVVVMRGAAGAVAIEKGTRAEIAAAPVAKLIDTTGAGDLFAAGFLAGLCRGCGIERCLEIGALAAAEAISHFGARPEADLRELVRL